jgi:Ran GTPase-activating protein (RanGAP) involved in mRNA processing and transport
MIKQCSKAIVNCLACDWIGLREELPTHLDVCSGESLSTNRSTEDLMGKFIPISDINLDKQNFQKQDIAIAVKALLINKRSTCLDLFNKGLSSKGASIIASVLHNDTCLEILSLRNNRICDSGVQYIAHALLTNSTLKRLDLNENSITDIGVRLLIEMLKTNTTLIKLTLSFNRITNEGLNLFFDVLMNNNSTLQWLSLTGNSGINDSSMNSIIHFIRYNRSLKTLNLEDCHLSSWHKKQIYFSHVYSRY